MINSSIQLASGLPTMSNIHSPILQDLQVLSPTFLISILAGVVLALAFQFILTAISVATGVSAIGDIKKEYVKSKVDPGNSKSKNEYEFDQDYSADTPLGVKVTSAFGLWSVFTTCIALFGATALALNLNTVVSVWINATSALVIWGLFFLILFYLEAKMARTLIGNLISTATSGIKSSANMVGAMFSTPTESKMENIVENTIEQVRKEFDLGINTDKLSGVLDKFLSKVDRKIPDYENIKEDLEEIAKKSKSKNSSAKWMAMQQVLTKLITENSNAKADPEKKGKAEQLKSFMDSILEKYSDSNTNKEGIKNVVAEFTPLERKEIDTRIEKVREFISTSDNLDDKTIQAKLEEILNDPNVVTEIISNGYKDLDKQTIIDLLDDNTNLNKEELQGYADKIEKAIQRIAKEFDEENSERLVKRIEKNVANFFEGTGKEELDYSLLKNDVKSIMDDPKDSLEVIKKRFSTFDEETLRALVTNNKYIKEENIDEVLNTLTSVKTDVMDKISEIEHKANQQIELVKRKGVIQAEHARATASSAAWWLVATAILSGFAAIGGSMVQLF